MITDMQRTVQAREIAEELRMQVTSGRAQHYWDLPVERALHQMLGDLVSLRLWAQIDWYGPLEQWRAPEHEVSDIMFNGPPTDPIFVIQRGVMMNTGCPVHPEWIAFIQRQLLLRAGRLDPAGDGIWSGPEAQGVADRLRYVITAPPYSRGGPTLAIRMLPERWRSLDDLVQGTTITREASDLLLIALRHEASILVAGATGSGKTTLAAGFTQELGKTQRLVFVEDGGELPRTTNSVHLDVLGSSEEFTRAIRLTLRQKPNFVIVGEVRGGEAIALLQAASTGHPGIGTIHASDVQTALRSLERNAMIGLAAQASGGGAAAAAIVRSLITTISLIIVHIGKAPSGRRAVLAVEEVLIAGNQGQSGDKFPTNPLFRYDTTRDQLVRVGNVQGAWGNGKY